MTSRAAKLVHAVPAAAGWVPTEIVVQAGQAITVTATGSITVDPGSEVCLDPAGTFLHTDEIIGRQFPLPAAGAGPAPCFSLIGRIGNQPPFFIGRGKSWIASHTGPLWLAVNDFHHADNTGEFVARIESGVLRPMSAENVIDQNMDLRLARANLNAMPGGAIPNAQVVVFYMDGLRPDVIREMAAMGHIPNINELFVSGGTWMSNAFTAFPSDTITSNATMWTGCFSDRHGVKGQVRFSRRLLHSDSYLDPLGPHRSSTTLSPVGWPKLTQKLHEKTVGLVSGDEAERVYRESRVTNVPPLYEHLRRVGKDWATGVLPMMTDTPPLLWSRSLVRHMCYFHTHEAWKYIDEANTHYTQFRLLDREHPVTVVWLPETDSVSHKKIRGQFGLTRRTIAEADRLIGQVVHQLREQNRLSRTYFMLISDHGHHGGRHQHLTHFDLANEFFFAPREISKDGRWSGGGMGLSVRQHRFSNRHPGDRGQEFVFIDGDFDGAARVFLPAAHYQSGQWMPRSKPAHLLSYRIADHLPPVNLVETLTSIETTQPSTGHRASPIDLVMMKLTDCSILISTRDRGKAVIERTQTNDGRWHYRYSVVDNVQPLSSGEVAWRAVPNPQVDPLGLLKFHRAETLSKFHDERTWLHLTLPTDYPDSVVTLTRHLLWQANLREREREYAPDLVVTARPGWYFGTSASPGTMHGHPLADAMRATLFMSGPTIRRGTRIDVPCRLADLTPTLLELTQTPYNASELEGSALRLIYDGSLPPEILSEHEPGTVRLSSAESLPPLPVAPPPEPLDDQTSRLQATPIRRAVQLRPVYWHDVDLQAWHPLAYRANPPYRYLPKSINKPDSPFDLNNIGRNLVTVTDINIVRLADDVASPLTGGGQPMLRRLERHDLWVRWKANCFLSGTARALDVSNVGLGDYTITALGNLSRIDRGIDELQVGASRLNRKAAGVFGRESLPGLKLVNGTIDAAQCVFRETYRFAQLVLIKLIDETALNVVEDGIDHAINSFHRVPSEVAVP
ncbi:alkaline phosphatase family protein [Thalassoroseus pseudoceratinae]|uniref:alkaline phosphatase family protein n=1 Tax=Thalassoroseus pseudoceratinae TaxID=2713176 RepID=UPI00141EA2F6|nr:alkaline phosphatase family protein [Thalassoroseus pseudoceratinae]